MSVAAPVSIEDYLATHYRPDCDYVDGEILDRNVGEREHGFIQRQLIIGFYRVEAQLGISTWPEVRLQVSPTRFRVPDLCVYSGPDRVLRFFSRTTASFDSRHFFVSRPSRPKTG